MQHYPNSNEESQGQRVHIVGFGSQGNAWANCLRKSGWQVEVYLLRKGDSYERALQENFTPSLIQDFAQNISQNKKNPTQQEWVALLCPDQMIGSIYRDFLASCPEKIGLILAHGYSVYSGDLKVKPGHSIALLAPKAIGPKIKENFENSYPLPHSLVAAVLEDYEFSNAISAIARGIGFSKEALIPTSFETETRGDLISEQGLLCGGVFNLLLWTIEAMKKADIPDSLIREECLSELELIAGLLRSRGPSATFKAISQAAQCGTIAMANRLETSGFKKEFMAQVETVLNKEFVGFFDSGKWKPQAQELIQKFSEWEGKKS